MFVWTGPASCYCFRQPVVFLGVCVCLQALSCHQIVFSNVTFLLQWCSCTEWWQDMALIILILFYFLSLCGVFILSPLQYSAICSWCVLWWFGKVWFNFASCFSFLFAVKPPTIFYFLLIYNVKDCTTELSALSSVLKQNWQ